MEGRDRHGKLAKDPPMHKVRVKSHTRTKPVPMPAETVYTPPPPPSVGGTPIRYGHPFPSVEQHYQRQVTPFSNFEGGDEKDLRSMSCERGWNGEEHGHHLGPEGRDGDVSGQDRIDAHEVFEPRKPLTTRNIKPASSRSGLQRAQ